MKTGKLSIISAVLMIIFMLLTACSSEKEDSGPYTFDKAKANGDAVYTEKGSRTANMDKLANFLSDAKNGKNADVTATVFFENGSVVFQKLKSKDDKIILALKNKKGEFSDPLVCKGITTEGSSEFYASGTKLAGVTLTGCEGKDEPVFVTQIPKDVLEN